VGDAAEVFEQNRGRSGSTGGASWGCRTRNAGAAPDKGMLSAGSATKSWTFFWWQEGQNQGPYRRRPTGGPPRAIYPNKFAARNAGQSARTRGSIKSCCGRFSASCGLIVLSLPLRTLQQGGATQLQSACRIAAGANSPGIGLPGKQDCSYDLVRRTLRPGCNNSVLL
jgi:hypothetical protein